MLKSEYVSLARLVGEGIGAASNDDIPDPFNAT